MRHDFRKQRRHFAIAIVAIITWRVRPLEAAAIPTLFNTGVDANKTLLAGGNGVTDTHWSVISGPGITSPVSAQTFWDSVYAPNGPNSRFISNSADGSPGNGNFVFRTTFDLTGFDPAKTTLNGTCWVDNYTTAVVLNGVTKLLQGNICSNYFFSHSWTLTDGFVAGLNTLDITVVDTGLPMAFRAEFTSDTQAPAGVPTVITVNPKSGNTISDTFTFTFSDPDGYTDLDVLNVLVNNFLDGRNGCYLAYSRPTNTLYLTNDAGTALLPGLTLNGTGNTANSYCSVAAVSSSASEWQYADADLEHRIHVRIIRGRQGGVYGRTGSGSPQLGVADERRLARARRPGVHGKQSQPLIRKHGEPDLHRGVSRQHSGHEHHECAVADQQGSRWSQRLLPGIRSVHQSAIPGQ